MWFSPRTTRMKKYILSFLLLFTPFVTQAFTISHQDDWNVNPLVPIFNLTVSLADNASCVGSHVAIDRWVWIIRSDNYSTNTRVGEVMFASMVGTTDVTLPQISLVGLSNIDEFDFVCDDGVTDSANTQSYGGFYDGAFGSFNQDDAQIQFIVPVSSSGSSTPTEQTINNPTLDFFLGFLIFFICMVFPIWLFRRQ